MTSTVQTAAGSKIFIGTTASNPVGDTYTEIAYVTNIGEFGRMYEEIKFVSLGNRDTLKFKGPRDDGNITLDLGRSVSDAGQAAMILALDSDQDYNFKITLNDDDDTSGSVPTTFLFKAKVLGYQTNIGGPTDVVKAKTNLSIKTSSISEVVAH
jgi:hypothetical protein